MEIDKTISRRRVLRWSALTAGAVAAGCASSRRRSPGGEDLTEPARGLGAEMASPVTEGGEKQFLRVMLDEADGSTLAEERAKLLHARDLANDPLPRSIPRATGRVRIGLVRDEPMQIACRLRVPAFGEVYCYADNDGKGYTRPGQIDFVVDAARTRLSRVRSALKEAQSSGLSIDPELRRHLDAAARPIPAKPRPARIAAAYESLAHGLHAGEMLALAMARQRISRFSASRTDFGFGVMVSGYGSNPDYDRAVQDAFNFATCAWYTWKSPDPPYVDYARMDGSIDYCLARNITPKGFGYCYMTRGATPDWIRPVEVPATTLPTGEHVEAHRQYNADWPYERLRQLYRDVSRQTAAHYLQKYGDGVPYIEVLNEAHDKANLWQMSHEQVLEMARTVCDAVRQGHPRIKRQINHCCQWAEYAVRRNADGTRRWSPLMFARDCIEQGVEFETLGLQLYYPSYDLFEIDRMLRRHFVLNKPIHITEMSTSCHPGQDERSMRPRSATPPWHGDAWSESTQADWLEGIYTLAYSHRQIEVAEWWDLADTGGHFWPHGGLLNPDYTPRESYHRLLALQKRWGVAREMGRPA